MSSLTIVSTVLTLFLSMDAGLSGHFRDDTGVPTEENKELFEIKEVVGSWSSFMLFLCASLMFLTTANASSMDILERRFELSTLRALGTRLHHVMLLLVSPMAMVVFLGLLAGPMAVMGTLSFMGSDPRLPLGPDLGVPLAMDPIIVLSVVGIGSAAALVGMAPSLASVLHRSPLEVLRDAP